MFGIAVGSRDFKVKKSFFFFKKKKKKRKRKGLIFKVFSKVVLTLFRGNYKKLNKLLLKFFIKRTTFLFGATFSCTN